MLPLYVWANSPPNSQLSTQAQVTNCAFFLVECKVCHPQMTCLCLGWVCETKPYMEGCLKVKNWAGLGTERLCVEVMSAWQSAASKKDSRWCDAQPNTSHYHESTGREERHKKMVEWATKAEAEQNNLDLWHTWLLIKSDIYQNKIKTLIHHIYYKK